MLSDGTERRIDLVPSFGQDQHLSLRVLGSFGEDVVLRSDASHGAMAMGRLGTVNLVSKRVHLIPEPLSASADISIVGDRLARGPGGRVQSGSSSCRR